jgi:oligopeptide transport system substrate-binding protein
MSWTQDFRVALNIWEGLTTWHPETTEPVEGAAHFPPRISADGLTYTFTIRDDARWSNGEPLSAQDFVRGWRRGMEPGTATDYAYLFAEHVSGAEEYVQWRRNTAGALTALHRLREGWGVDARQGRALAQHSIFRHIQDRTDGALIVPVRDADESEWEMLAARLSDVRADWNTLYDHVFEEHVQALDVRFESVGIRTTDDRTLVVQLARPCPYFLDLTAFPIFLPCHRSIELLRERYRGSPITKEGLTVYDPQWTKPDYHHNGYPGLITNGPYKLADWIFKRRALLTVNPYYRAAGTITCRSVEMLVFENINAAIMAYEAGDVDFLPAMDVPYDHEIARLARSGERPDFHLCHVLATYFLNFNCATKDVGDRSNPFVDPLVRRAFSLAIDKEALVEKVVKRGDRVADSFVPADSIRGYDPPSGLRYAPEQARAHLAQAGFPNGAGISPVELLYTPRDERLCQAIARMWEEALNVRVELRSKETKTFAEDKTNYRYMVARGNWFADYNDPTTFLDCLVTGNGNNDSGYSNPRYDALLADARMMTDPIERAALLRQAEAAIVEEDCPILPIFHYALPIAIKPYVRGLYPNARLWFPFRYVTIER